MRLNLRLFDGEAGAAGAPVAGAQAAGAQAAGTQAAEPTVLYGKQPGTQEEEPPDRNKAFEDLIKGEYKDLYSERVKKEVARRTKGMDALKTQLDSQKEILNLLGTKYGVDASDMSAVKKAMEEDHTYWEQAAEREGLTVEQYKRFKRMEAENASLRAAEEERKRLTQREQVFSEWNRQAEELKAIYPSFDLGEEMQNESFGRLLGAGIDVRTAYEAVNHEKLTAGAMAYTAQAVAKKQADAIRSGQARPMENGISSRAAVEVKADVSKLTDKDMDEIVRRVRNGERIEF